VLIVNGLGYESWLAKSLQVGGKQPVIIVATQGLTSHADPSGEHPGGDPHMWMDPLNAVRYAESIRDGLTRADPAGKDVYAANADVYIAKLKALDASIKADVEQLPPEKRLLVTNLYIETLSPRGGPAATYIDMLKHDAGLILSALGCNCKP